MRKITTEKRNAAIFNAALSAMALLEKYLVVQPSTIPGAGKGLFTTTGILKGSRIVEYKGEVKSWEEVRHDSTNAYVYFIKPNYVIDARNQPGSLARYVNDAEGLTKARNKMNNARFVTEGHRVFVEAIRDIAAGEEIFVDYGKRYWDTVRKNRQLSRAKKPGNTPQ